MTLLGSDPHFRVVTEDEPSGSSSDGTAAPYAHLDALSIVVSTLPAIPAAPDPPELSPKPAAVLSHPPVSFATAVADRAQLSPTPGSSVAPPDLEPMPRVANALFRALRAAFPGQSDEARVKMVIALRLGTYVSEGAEPGQPPYSAQLVKIGHHLHAYAREAWQSVKARGAKLISFLQQDGHFIVTPIDHGRNLLTLDVDAVYRTAGGSSGGGQNPAAWAVGVGGTTVSSAGLGWMGAMHPAVLTSVHRQWPLTRDPSTWVKHQALRGLLQEYGMESMQALLAGRVPDVEAGLMQVRWDVAKLGEWLLLKAEWAGGGGVGASLPASVYRVYTHVIM